MMKKVVWIMVFAFCVSCLAMSQNIFIVTEDRELEVEGAGNLGDYLRGFGYTVTVDANEGLGVSDYEGILEDDEIAYLESFDVVLVHRSISSGDFDDFIEQWNDLDVPLFQGSGYLVRNTRWFWVDAAHQRSTWSFLDIVEADHPVVSGLTGDLFEFDLEVDHVAPGDVGDGTIIATILNDNAEDAPAIIAWEPGDNFAEAGGQVAGNARLFLPIYRYHEHPDNGLGNTSDPADGLFENYTENGLEMIHQGIEWLLTFAEPTNISHWECY